MFLYVRMELWDYLLVLREIRVHLIIINPQLIVFSMKMALKISAFASVIWLVNLFWVKMSWALSYRWFIKAYKRVGVVSVNQKAELLLWELKLSPPFLFCLFIWFSPLGEGLWFNDIWQGLYIIDGVKFKWVKNRLDAEKFVGTKHWSMLS